MDMLYTKLWEVVNNSKSIDGIDFQKNLSKGRRTSLNLCHKTLSPGKRLHLLMDIYTKLWKVVSNTCSRSMDGIDFQKNLSMGIIFLGGGLS
jgi:hypothetical protein